VIVLVEPDRARESRQYRTARGNDEEMGRMQQEEVKGEEGRKG